MSLGISLVAVARMATCMSALISPSFTAYAFGLPYHDAASVPWRWAGARELVLGTFQWVANTGTVSSSPSSDLLTPVLVAASIIDVIDIVSAGVYVIQGGNLSVWTLSFVVGGPVAFLLVQFSTLKGLRKRKAL
jgi:hypothetical protein